MSALTITAEECAFTMPVVNGDWRKIHKDVHEVINGPTPADRSWIFSVTPMPPDDRVAIVTARAPVLGDHLEKTPSKLSVHAGDRLRLECPLACSRRHKGENGCDVERPVPALEVPEFAASVLGRFGMSPESVDVQSYQRRFVRKPAKDFFVVQAGIIANVTITDPALFAQAYLYGVGRKKTYGFGMLEVIDDVG